MGNKFNATKIFMDRKRSSVTPQIVPNQVDRWHGNSSRVLLNQKVLPRQKIVKYELRTPAPDHNFTQFNDFFKRKKFSIALAITLFTVVVSAVPLTIGIRSYLWERGQTLISEGDVLYDLFITEAFREGTRQSLNENGPGSVTMRGVVPTLRVQGYRVRKGDSLFALAQRYKISLDTIISANQLRDAYIIPIGMELKIPNLSGIYYSVKKGDSLSSISARFKVDLNKLVDINDLDSSLIYVGQRLFIPGARLSDWERAAALGTLFKYPARGRLTSKVGFRIDPFTKRRAYHAGIDLANRVGTTVQASQSGKVTYVGYRGNYGKTIIIAHQQGYTTLYGHLDKILVKRGQVVRQGEKIGTMGNSGRSTGPHLHFELRQYHRFLDPLKILHR